MTTNMSKKKDTKFIVIFIIIAVLFVALSVLVNFLFRNASKIPDNDPFTIGTTAGNLYHNGLFCELDGVVYFSNPYDSGSLYSMQPGQTDITKLAAGEIYYINAAGNYIYYYANSVGGDAGLGYLIGGRGIYRCDLNGKSSISIAKITCDGLLLLGSNLYYTNFAENPENEGTALVTLNSVTINGEDEAVIAEGHPQLGTAANGALYYSSMEDNYLLYSYNPGNESVNIAVNMDMYQPIVQSNTVYYMDIHDDYRLKAYSLGDGSVRTIVDERVDCFNVSGSIIYYQNCDPDNYALMRIYTDGTGEEVVRNGVHQNINITSEYVYFTGFNSDMPIYQTPTYGAVNVRTFDAAITAANEALTE